MKAHLRKFVFALIAILVSQPSFAQMVDDDCIGACSASGASLHSFINGLQVLLADSDERVRVLNEQVRFLSEELDSNFVRLGNVLYSLDIAERESLSNYGELLDKYRELSALNEKLSIDLLFQNGALALEQQKNLEFRKLLTKVVKEYHAWIRQHPGGNLNDYDFPDLWRRWDVSSDIEADLETLIGHSGVSEIGKPTPKPPGD